MTREQAKQMFTAEDSYKHMAKIDKIYDEFESENIFMASLPNTSTRDWKEDFHLENGCYQSKCIECKLLFYGYKRRLWCKTCFSTLKIKP